MINCLRKKILVLVAFVFICLIFILMYSKINLYKKNINNIEKLSANVMENLTSNVIFEKSYQIVDQVVYDNTIGKIVWDNLTMSELIDKLNRVLNSDLALKGEIFAKHSLELGMDPYLVVAISLQETGCAWNCSYLVKACNNVGGQKGSPGCDGGSYKMYNTLDEGIIGFIDNLYYNYYLYGLTTPESMNSKYAMSSSWASRVNSYIEKIKAA